uniref:Uncharacterized protein n=1 Tax=Strigamia maritima TaxID=126957 RepID=T1JL12_STRMM
MQNMPMLEDYCYGGTISNVIDVMGVAECLHNGPPETVVESGIGNNDCLCFLLMVNSVLTLLSCILQHKAFNVLLFAFDVFKDTRVAVKQTTYPTNARKCDFNNLKELSLLFHNAIGH